MLSLTFTTFLIKPLYLKPLEVVLLKHLNCSSATPPCLPKAPTHSKATHLHTHPLFHFRPTSCICTLCLLKQLVSLLPTNHVVRNSVAHLSHTQYGTKWRGVQSKKTESFPSCCSRTCPAHFVAQTQLCRIVLFNSVSVQDYLSHQIQQA